MNRRLIVTCAIIAILGFVAYAVFNEIMGKGTLTLTASDSNAAIAVTRTAPSTAEIDTKGLVGKFSKRLPVGTYLVSATTKDSSVRQIVELKGNNTTTVSLTFAQPAQMEVVTNMAATSMTDDGASFTFRNPDSNTLMHVAGQNQLTAVGSTGFSSIQWADSSYGVGIDTAGKFHTIQNTVVGDLAVPATSEIGTTFVVAPNRTIYISDGKKLYRSEAGQFKQIYVSEKPFALLGASNQAVLGSEQEPKSSTSAEPQLVRINTANGVKRINGESYTGDWSPAGDRVIVNSDERSSVLDMDLNEVTKIPHSNINSPIWLDESNIAYSVAGALWKFNTATGQDQIIAQSPNLTYSSKYLSKDGSYIYVSTQNFADGKNHTLQRLGLKNQPISTPSAILGKILPNTLGVCKLSYLNFTSPSVVVQAPKASQATCLQTAQKYLQAYKVDLKSTTLNFSAF